jgi:PRTRC genetic system protein E
MNNKFFQQINNLLLISETVNITIRKNNENELTVSVNPLIKVQDKAKDLLQPILFTGTVEEFDAQFFQLLAKPLQKTSGLLRNIHQHEQSVEKAKEESAIAKAEKEKQKKVREHSVKQLEKAQKYWDEKEYDKCKFICNQILKDDPKFSKATQLVKECDANNSQPDMFSQPLPDVPRAEPEIPIAEPCESIVTPVSENTYPDGTPKFHKEMENVDEEIRMQDKEFEARVDEANIEEHKTPPTQENNSLGMTDEQTQMIIDQRNEKLNNNPSNYTYY